MPEGYLTPTKKKKPNQGFLTKTNSISPPTIIPGSPQLPGVGAQLIPGTPEIRPPEGQGGWLERTHTTPAAEVAKADPGAIVFPFESKMGQSLHAGEYYNPDDAYLDAYIEAKDKVDFDWSTWDEIVFGSNEIDPKTGKRIGGGIVGMLWEDVVAKPAKQTWKDPLTTLEVAGDLVPTNPLKSAVRSVNMARELSDPASGYGRELGEALSKLPKREDETFLGYGSLESLKAMRDIARLTLGRLMGPEAGTQMSKGHATLLEGAARGTVDLGILGQMIGASTEAGDVGRAQLEVDKHLNIMAKRHWAKRGGKYDKTVNWLYGKPDLVGIPEEVIQSWEEDAKPKFDKLKAAKRAKWRVLNILMTERERARTGKETQIGSWMKANGDKKGAAKFEKKVVSAFAEQSSYFADPGSAAGALAGMGSKVAAQTAGKGFLRRTTQKGMEGAGDYIAGAGVAVREASTSVSQKAEQAVAKLVDDPDAAKLATQALPGRVGTLARVGELTGTAIETAGQVISSTGRIIGDGPGQRGFLGRIGQDKSVRLRHLIPAGLAGEILDGTIDLGVNTMKAGGTGAAVGGGLGALTGEEEFAIAGAATGGFLGVGQSVPMHMFGVHQKAKQANDVKAWIEAKPEETRALLGKLDFEQQLSMANVESLVKGVSDQAGAGDVDVRYVHGDDAEAIRHERGAWIGEKGELVVNLNHPESAGHTLAHESMHALEDLPHEGMQERIAALNAKLFDTLDIDGNLLTKGLYSLDDEVSFVNQYQNLLNHETIPHWRIDMGLEGTGRITKEQYLKSQELRSSMQKEVRAESFASMARSSDIGAVTGVKQRFMDHIMLAENTSKLARLRDVLMGQGVKFESDGAPSALFVKKTVLKEPSKPGGKGVVEYKPITNNKEVNALLRDFVRVRRKIRQELAPEPGEEAGSSYTMKQLSEPGNERIAHYFRDNDTFAKDNEGNVLMAGGKPVRLSQREINELQKKRSNAMLGALDNVDGEGGLQRQELKNGKYEWVGHHMNDAQLAAMMALPNDVFAPSLKEKLRRINYQMQREGATLLIDYNAALKGGKYSSAISSAWRHDSPFGMRLTAARNLTITGFNIDRVLGKMNQWRGDKKGRFLDLWGGDYNAFKQSMHQYMDNHMNNRPGHTDLDADATTAIHKKDRINELFDVPDSEAKRDLTLGVGRRPRLISSRRFDRINQVRDGEGNWHTDYGKIKENKMPAGEIPTTPKGDEGAQYMPAGKKVVERQLKSGRQSGAVLNRAIVPQDYVPKYLKEGDRILDAGAGQHAKFAEGFRKQGHKVDAFDLPENMVKGLHQKDWAKRKHDVSYSSRVLNVMDSRKDMSDFVGQVAGALTKDGKYIVNVPDSPRYGAFKRYEGKPKSAGDRMVKRVLLEHFNNVEEIGAGGHRKSSVLLASNPKTSSVKYMPAGKDIEVAPGLVRAKVDSEFKLSKPVLAQYMPAGKKVDIMAYADRDMFTLAADNLVTGIDPLVGPTGAKMPVGVEAQGGRGFQFLNPKKMIWAFKGSGTATTLLKRGLDVSGGKNTVIVGVTSQGSSTHFNSPYGLYAFAKSLEAAANSKTFPQRRVDQHIKDLMTLVGRTKDDKFTAGQRNAISNIKGLASLLRAVTPTRANPQGKIGFHAAGIIKEKFKQIGKLEKAKLEIIQPELEAAGLHLKELMHDLSDPGLRDAKIGDVVALVELDLTKAPKKTDFHFSYPWTIQGKPIGFLKKFPNVRDLTSDTRIYTKRTGQMTSQPLQTVMPEFNLLKSGDVSYMPAGKSGGEVFYSNSAKALESPKVPKAANGPAMLNAMIKGGANLQEMKWMDLDRFLMDHKGKVTKEQVQDFIDTNQIQVMEKVRGGEERMELEWAIHDMEDAERTMYEADDRGTYRDALDAEEAFEAASEHVRELGEDSDTLHGGGELTLPGAKKGSYRELELMLPRNEGEKFLGPEAHWGKDENVFASVRFNERTDADGKRMLFIEEVQSDWAATGREQGFSPEKGLDVATREFNDLMAESAKRRGLKPGRPAEPRQVQELLQTEGFADHYSEKIGRENYLRLRELSKQDVSATPEAPFVSKRKGGKMVEDDKWRAVAFKRMLRWAADEGFSRVGWINGTDTAKRYDLSKTLNSVEWQRMPGEDTVHITALDKEGKAVISDKPVNINKLKNTVGRELSEKILASDKISGEFTGLELEVGGEGHKQFYDVDLPNYVRKYVKKWGGEVGEVGMSLAELLADGKRRLSPGQQGGRTTAHYTDITPAMKKSVMTEGQAMFMPAGREYAGKHEAPTSDGGSPGHDVARLTYPDDIYGPKAAQYYGHYGQNDPMDVSAIRVIHGMKGNPNKPIEIYRAVPKGLKEPKLSTGDWVTITRKYAKEHGEATLEGSYEIITQSVTAKDIWTDGNSIHEWGYDPQTSKQLRLERDLKKLKRN